jgi:hypothetical protein
LTVRIALGSAVNSVGPFALIKYSHNEKEEREQVKDRIASGYSIWTHCVIVLSTPSVKRNRLPLVRDRRNI